MLAVRALAKLPTAESVRVADLDAFVADVCERLLVFSTAARRDHPAASRWALTVWGETSRRWQDQRRQAVAAVRSLATVKSLGPEHGITIRPEDDAPETVTFIASVLGVMTRWMAGLVDDDELDTYRLLVDEQRAAVSAESARRSEPPEPAQASNQGPTA